MNYNKLFKLSALSLMALTMWSCTKDVDYDPANPEANAQVFFSTDATTSFDLAENQSSIKVEVTRINTSGSLTVNLSSSASVGGENTDIFTVPASVTFADGAATAEIPVEFDFNEIKPETDYLLTLTLEGDALSLYGKSQQEVTIAYAPWSEWTQMEGTGTYNNAAPFGGLFDAAPIYKRNSLLNPDLVQYNLYSFWMDEEDFLINVDLSDNSVTVPVQKTGTKSGGDMIQFCDSYTFFSEVASGDPELYKGRSTFNPENGVMTINMVFFMIKAAGGIGWWGADNFDYVQLPGYPNYEIAVTNSGTYISEGGMEYTILSVSKGTDVASYAIKLVQGSLGEDEIQAEVDAIVADTETTLYTENQDFQFPVAEEDYYSCITVSYGSDGEAKGHNVYVFYNELNGKDWNEGWKTLTTNCEFYDLFMSGAFGLPEPTEWQVEVQESIDNPGYYRIVKPYEAVSEYYGMEMERGHYYIEIDATDPDAVMVNPSLNCLGYWVLSVAPGKLAGDKITFPANSCGIFNGIDQETGDYKLLAPWGAEAVLLDLNYVEEQPEEPATRSRAPKLRKNVRSASVIPFKGKKIERKPSFIEMK